MPKKKNIYNVFHYGITGKMGEGANTEVNFLQTSLKMKELENIKLLLEIPGSEKWSVKDLFQRNVNRKRIMGAGGLRDYFTDCNQVKYFNPIALVLLPMDNHNIIQKDLPKLKQKKDIIFDGISGSTLSNTEHYKLYLQDSNDGNIGKIEWNSENCHVVAIDGQHRLTALKELYDLRSVDSKGMNIENWQIPVVFIIADKKVASGESKDLINIMRKLFMYINMEAKKVNPARAILLNDESIECLCVQELITAFHVNDFSENIENKLPPLYLLDWTGDSDSSNVNNTRYLFSNIELRNWMRDYLVGEDFTATARKSDNLQMRRLELQDLSLDFLNYNTCLSPSDGEQIRSKFNELMLDGIINFITNLIPIKNYIEDCRRYEEENSIGSSEVKAFAELRYGYAPKEQSNKMEIDDFVSDYNDKFISFKKDRISDFFRQDIAMRGFIYAYSELYEIQKNYLNRSIDWDKHTQMFLPAFNNLISSGWCESWDTLEIDKRNMLTHICHSETGKRINYKLNDVKNSWGIFVVMNVLDYSVKQNIVKTGCKIESWDNYRDRFENTLEKGFREVAKREASTQEMTAEQRKRYINDRKKELTKERMCEFVNLWCLDENE